MLKLSQEYSVFGCSHIFESIYTSYHWTLQIFKAL